MGKRMSDHEKKPGKISKNRCVRTGCRRTYFLIIFLVDSHHCSSRWLFWKICSKEMSSSFSTNSAVWEIIQGSHVWPRNACGGRNGASVSSNKRSYGTERTRSRKCSAFLYVTFPAIPIYAPISIACL